MEPKLDDLDAYRCGNLLAHATLRLQESKDALGPVPGYIYQRLEEVLNTRTPIIIFEFIEEVDSAIARGSWSSDS